MAPIEPRRRTVSILFSDLVGSTDLGERLDPETMQDALDRYFASCSKAITRHGGVIEKFIGDAIVAVFGLQETHEDDALRAVRAAVEMQDALALVNEGLSRDFEVQLQARTGVNTGEVVANDPSRGQRLITGDAVNVAARLEQSAMPGSILIGETTFALVRAAGTFESMPPLRVKGKAEALVAHRVESIETAPASEAPVSTPFVDRHRELARLMEILATPRGAREGTPIIVVGEAGIGKSRLVAEALVSPTLLVLRGRCLPYGDGITYWPIAQVLRTIGEIHAEDDEQLTRRKLRDTVHTEVDDELIVAPLASILTGMTTYPAEEVARAFRTYVDALATDRDVALLIEDVHWAEPTLLDLIQQTARSTQVSVVCTTRPAATESGSDDARTRLTIALEPLAGEHTDELLSLLAGWDVAPAIRTQLVEAAGGNPFFLEQIVSMLKEEAGLTLDLREGGELSIPPTVAAVLHSRLDLLPPGARETVERAAVVGKVFYREALDTLSPPDEDARRSLEELVSRRFVEPSPSDLPGYEAYAFRHILIHEAAYRGTLKRRRAEWHERLAVWLEEGAPGGGREEFIGFHLERAYRLREELGHRDDQTRELASRASASLAIAGQRAADRNDAAAAAGLLGRAISLLPEHAHDLRVPLMVDLSLAQLDAGSVAEALRTARAAEDLAAGRVDRATELRANAAAIFVEIHAENPDIARMTAEAREIENELEGLDDARAQMEAALTLGIAEYAMGQMGSSTARLEAAAKLAREIGETSSLDRILDWFVAALDVGPMPVSIALLRCDEVIASTRPRSRVEASARLSKGMLYAMASQRDQARIECDLARAIYEELRMPLEVAASNQARASVELLSGDPSLVVEDLRSDLVVLEQMNALGYRANSALKLARSLEAIGDDAGAMALIEEVKAEVPETDVVGVVESASVEVRSLLRHDRYVEAEALARRAIEMARPLDHSELLPAALTDLADVLVERGEPDAARELLHEARALHQSKENVAAAARVEARLDRLRR